MEIAHSPQATPWRRIVVTGLLIFVLGCGAAGAQGVSVSPDRPTGPAVPGTTVVVPGTTPGDRPDLTPRRPIPIPDSLRVYTRPDSTWWQFQRDAANSGRVPGLGTLRSAQLLWDSDVGLQHINHEVTGPPVFGREHVFLRVGLLPSGLYALSRSDGAVAWSYEPSDPSQRLGRVMRGAPVAANRRVYSAWEIWTPTESGYEALGRVVALKATDGSELWSTELPTAPIASPTIIDGRILVHGRGNRLYVIEQETGALWRDIPYPDASALESAPVAPVGLKFKETLAYVAGAEGISAFSIDRGQLQWQRFYRDLVDVRIDEPLKPTSVMIYDAGDGRPVLLVAARPEATDWNDFVEDIIIAAVHPTSGRSLWTERDRINTRILTHLRLVAGDGEAIVLARDMIRSFDPHTGALNWQVEQSFDIYEAVPAPAFAYGWLFFPSHGLVIRGGEDRATVLREIAIGCQRPPEDYYDEVARGAAVDGDLLVVTDCDHSWAYRLVPE